jgi:hypothetical protein
MEASMPNNNLRFPGSADLLAAGHGSISQSLPLPGATTDNSLHRNEYGEKSSKVADDSGLREKILAFTPEEYELKRKSLAKEYGVRPAYLDSIRREAEPEKVQGREIALEEPEPWPTHVDGARLLDALVSQIRRFLVAPPFAIEAAALWLILSYLVDRAACLPLLVFFSATKRCGKTTGLEIVSRLALKALPASTITSAALFRVVEKYRPTLVLDEADSIFKENEDLRTLVNASFSRTAAFAIRCAGEDQEPRIFSTWCPKALGLIGRLPPTLADRSILIPMRRKKSEETVERLRADEDQGFEELRRKIVRWTRDNTEALKRNDPQIPIELNDRQADAWRELFRIADVAGGAWPKIARDAAIAICAQSDSDDDDVRTLLLRDLKALFASATYKTAFTSEEIVEHLATLEDRPWPGFAGGRGFSKNNLARFLKPFGVQAAQVKTSGRNVRAYRVEDFKELFSRYLETTATRSLFEHNAMLSKDISRVAKSSGSGCEDLPPQRCVGEPKEAELEIF